MICIGRMTITRIIPLMDCYTGKIVVHFNGIGSVDDLEAFSDQCIRHTVMVAVLSKDDVIILGNFALGSIFYLVD